MKKLKGLIVLCTLLGSFWAIYNSTHGNPYYILRCIAFGGSRFAMQRFEFVVTAPDFDGMCYARLTQMGYAALSTALNNPQLPNETLLTEENINQLAAGDQNLKQLIIELKNEIPEDNQSLGALRAKLPELRSFYE